MKKWILLLLFFFPMIVLADSGSSTIVMDVPSGRILYEKNSHSPMLIASTTKIMTCLIVLENVDLLKEVEVGEEVLSMYGTNIYLEVGEKITVKDLLYGLMLRSGNDAAVVLSKATFGDEETFVEAMNRKAQKIGMKDTHFSNVHGLDDKSENISTAYDMALLSRYAYQNPIYREIISTKKYQTKSSLKSYRFLNRVKLLSSYSPCVGGKNGYTPKAGKSLVSYAKKDNFLLTIVSLDDPSIYENHKSLYEHFFQEYQNYEILNKYSFQIDSSLVSDRNFFIQDSFYYPLTQKELSKVSTLLSIDSTPLSSQVGHISIYLDHQLIGKIDVFEKEKKKKDRKSIFQRIYSYFTEKR